LSSSPKGTRRRKPEKKAARRKAVPARALTHRREDGEEFRFSPSLPLLPLRDVVIFPGMIVPLLVGRPASVAAVERALAGDKIFCVLAQKDPREADPGPAGLHDVGTIVRALQMLRIPDGTMRLLVEGVCRVSVRKVEKRAGHFTVRVAVAEAGTPATSELKALVRQAVAGFQRYVQLNSRIPDEVLAAVSGPDSPSRLAHVISGHLLIDVAAKQRLLAMLDLKQQLTELIRVLGEEIEVLGLERKIEGQVRDRVSRGQKEFWLHEQLKAIRKELGEGAEDESGGRELTGAVRKAGMPKEVRDKALSEVDRLGRMSPMSPEATVVRGWVETLIELPWRKRTRDRLDVAKAAKILDEDHYGLAKVKDRILEYLSVVKLVKRPRGSILCLVGPPGVGKTSLGRSVARALGRRFVRVALGGIRDEAEIRGHRRTYIGSMPGRIIQGIRRAGTKNPVFLLDEVDKLSSDFRGDPSSALLEVLDPEQNKAFNDHYLEVDFDLSEVLFITTANVLPAIPPALRDRMEVLRLPGYLEHEKVGIARKFLLPRQIARHGLAPSDVAVSEQALRTIVTRYTREAGVRNVEREIATVCRKIARGKAQGRGRRVKVGVKTLEKLLGPPRFPERRLSEEDRVGAAWGLAWTEYGGDVLACEVVVMSGSGKIQLTGRLGEVMRESARAALSYARTRAQAFGLAEDFADRVDLHVHMPEGAIPKDGPSAGVCIATAVISALLRTPVRRDVAMTGEITLHGKVLPIGGLNEKVVAAALAGFRQVLVPKANQPDWAEISDVARKGLEVTFVEHVDDVLRQALVPTAHVERLLEPKPHGEGLPGFAH
jgi:ATP-dependent Lon protease